MAESDAVRISREYREQLVRNEDAALKRMSGYWAKMERETRDNMLLLAQEVMDLKKAGQAVPIQYIYSMERYRKMLEQLNALVPDYEHRVLEIIEETQRTNYTLGLESANAIIQASHPSDDMWTRIHQDAAEAMAGYAGNGAPLAELLRTDYGAMTGRITDALVSGIGLGKGYKQVAQDMMDAAAIDFRRSVLIARTETNRAYRQANADQYRKSGVVEKVLRLCAMSGSCAACIIMDGWECRDGICDDHPNGKCTTVVVTTGGIMPEWEHGADWLAKQSAADQRAILGEGRYELYKQGVPLSEMVTMKENLIWGGSPSMVPIKDLKPDISMRFISIPENRDMASGMRQPVYHELTKEEISSLKEDIREIGAKESVFRFNTGKRTGYRDDLDIINVRGDVLPDLESSRARDKMSSRAVLAHEYYGHRAYRGTKLAPGSWNDEFRASYMAAKNSPGLSDEDRYYLIQDAIDRAIEKNIKIRYNQFMKEVLYGGIYE